MFDLDYFIHECRAALAADPSEKLVREAVRRAVRSAVEDVWGKRPVAKVLLIKG